MSMQWQRPLVENLNDCEVKEHSLPNTQTLNLKLQHLASGVKQKSGGEKQWNCV